MAPYLAKWEEKMHKVATDQFCQKKYLLLMKLVKSEKILMISPITFLTFSPGIQCDTTGRSVIYVERGYTVEIKFDFIRCHTWSVSMKQLPTSSSDLPLMDSSKIKWMSRYD